MPAYTEKDTAELIRHLTAECERAARRMRYWDTRPEELRAYAGRIESGLAPNADNLAALCLESAARAGREYLEDQK